MTKRISESEKAKAKAAKAKAKAKAKPAEAKAAEAKAKAKAKPAERITVMTCAVKKVPVLPEGQRASLGSPSSIIWETVGMWGNPPKGNKWRVWAGGKEVGAMSWDRVGRKYWASVRGERFQYIGTLHDAQAEVVSRLSAVPLAITGLFTAMQRRFFTQPTPDETAKLLAENEGRIAAFNRRYGH